MRLINYLLILVILMGMGILCVWQQVEMVRVSYEIKRTESEAAGLLDRHRSLRYNVASLSSPSRLTRELVARNLELRPPQNLEVVRLFEVTPKEVLNFAGQREGRGFLASIFTLGAQAEANQVK